MTGILPTYQRFVNGVPVPSISRRSFRLREKYLIVSVLLTFGIVWLGALFYLPEFKSANSVNDSVYNVYKRIQKAGPELLMPPPLAQNDVGDFPVVGIVHHGEEGDDPHKIEDRNRLLAKIDEEMGMKVLERPQFDVVPSVSSSKGPSKPPVDAIEEPALDKSQGKNVSPSGPKAEGSDNKYVAVALAPGASTDVKHKLDVVKQYYNQYKSRVKAKNRSIRHGIAGTGGGPAACLTLTPLEERLCSIVGGGTSPLPVRHNPVEAIVLDDDRHGSLTIEGQADAEVFENVVVEPGVYNINIESQELVIEPFISGLAIENSEDPELEPPIATTNYTIEQSTPTREESRLQTHRKTTVKQHRSRRPRQPLRTVNNEFEEVGNHLASMEKSRIEVDKQLVCAINRLAAASEGFVELAKNFVEFYKEKNQPGRRQSKRYKKMRLSSTSEED